MITKKKNNKFLNSVYTYRQIFKNVVVILPKFVIIKVGKDEGYGKKNK